MTLITSIRPAVNHTARTRSGILILQRRAQTAVKPDVEDQDQTSSMSNWHRHRVDSPSHPRKGKQRANPFAEQYRFPQKGRDGGAPDPFEVLGVDKSASEKEVKQQCA